MGNAHRPPREPYLPQAKRRASKIHKKKESVMEMNLRFTAAIVYVPVSIHRCITGKLQLSINSTLKS